MIQVLNLFLGASQRLSPPTSAKSVAVFGLDHEMRAMMTLPWPPMPWRAVHPGACPTLRGSCLYDDSGSMCNPEPPTRQQRRLPPLCFFRSTVSVPNSTVRSCILVYDTPRQRLEKGEKETWLLASVSISHSTAAGRRVGIESMATGSYDTPFATGAH